MYQVFRAILSILVVMTSLRAEDVTIGNRQFTIPDGYRLERVTSESLTKRPMVVDFDEHGHLYVAESSGTNDDVKQQLVEKPHSIHRLVDSDDDGVFDQRSVFADNMMFPEGAMWHDGSLFVSAPPQIWKLTDTNDDGVADKREVWFDAKTLTGCANDLHGPYAGPDGWIYWCKGAFAEQTYQGRSGAPFVTRAAHIFRRRPSGGIIEPVMIGGMDNPVEVAFTETGERIFTTTFFQHPANGQRDGLVHAIYGGVYGKQHGVIDGHPRTGDLMPVMTHLGAAAPSGLTRLKSDTLGLQNQLVSACFNLHSVKRHELIRDGATFKTRDFDLVSSADLDFHPTDVIEDADGSLLIVDTGGWYKLCCPTSQLHKPDVLGAIYRLSKLGAAPGIDPRGKHIDWDNATATELVPLLRDGRFAIRSTAVSRLSQLGVTAVPQLSSVVKDSTNCQSKINAVWAACRIDHPEARTVVRSALNDADTTVSQAAVHAVSVWRDADALPALKRLLSDDSVALRRVAAEAIGRVGTANDVPDILAALATTSDKLVGRVLQHSLTYALIEINAAQATRRGLASLDPSIRKAAFMALHAMPNGEFGRSELHSLLSSEDAAIRDIATEIAVQHPEWCQTFMRVFEKRLSPTGVPAGIPVQDTARQLVQLCDGAPVRGYVLRLLESTTTRTELKLALLQSIRESKFKDDEWTGVLGTLLADGEKDVVAAVVRIISGSSKLKDKKIATQLAAVAKSDVDTAVRLQAIQCLDEVDDDLFRFAVACVSSTKPAHTRGLAATAISGLKPKPSQLLELAASVRDVGPLELSRILDCFEGQSDPKLGQILCRSLIECPSATSLPPLRVVRLAEEFGGGVLQLIKPLLAVAPEDPAKQAQHLEDLLKSLPPGDIRRGQRVFHSEKTACFACHAIGYRGGTVGPDLSRISRIRSPRDLLESIVYPSASFVRSYEPVNIVTSVGQQFAGTIRDQSAEAVILQLNATEQRVLQTADIEETLPSKVSIMPAGLEKQLTKQELADLLAFLVSRK